MCLFRSYTVVFNLLDIQNCSKCEVNAEISSCNGRKKKHRGVFKQRMHPNQCSSIHDHRCLVGFGHQKVVNSKSKELAPPVRANCFLKHNQLVARPPIAK
mmetsp:Transcript_31667/g.41855  ORF Transcript_31667/g.41855 Transcript_31667/m.41855 type:complete len:100 (-) Transcript_31667:430-729(-)